VAPKAGVPERRCRVPDEADARLPVKAMPLRCGATGLYFTRNVVME
jgi:hypothetical protein